LEYAKNAASLAFLCALAGRRAGALRMLWRSRKCVWHGREWRQRAGMTLVRALAPTWFREAVRGHRLKAARGR
jgi:hypothetical protein